MPKHELDINRNPFKPEVKNMNATLRPVYEAEDDEYVAKNCK
jgi:hypothetical protein